MTDIGLDQIILPFSVSIEIKFPWYDPINKTPLLITGAISTSLRDSSSFLPDLGYIDANQFNLPLDETSEIILPSSRGTYILLFCDAIEPDPLMLRGTFLPL